MQFKHKTDIKGKLTGSLQCWLWLVITQEILTMLLRSPVTWKPASPFRMVFLCPEPVACKRPLFEHGVDGQIGHVLRTVPTDV